MTDSINLILIKNIRLILFKILKDESFNNNLSIFQYWKQLISPVKQD